MLHVKYTNATCNETPCSFDMKTEPANDWKCVCNCRHTGGMNPDEKRTKQIFSKI